MPDADPVARFKAEQDADRPGVYRFARADADPHSPTDRRSLDDLSGEYVRAEDYDLVASRLELVVQAVRDHYDRERASPVPPLRLKVFAEALSLSFTFGAVLRAVGMEESVE